MPLLACGDLTAARRRADDVLALAKGISLVAALTCRAHVAIAQGDVEQAGDDARQALDVGADTHGYVTIPDAFECLAYIAGDEGSHREAARLFGAADAARRQTGIARFKTLTPTMSSGWSLFDKPWARATSMRPGMRGRP